MKHPSTSLSASNAIHTWVSEPWGLPRSPSAPNPWSITSIFRRTSAPLSPSNDHSNTRLLFTFASDIPKRRSFRRWESDSLYAQKPAGTYVHTSIILSISFIQVNEVKPRIQSTIVSQPGVRQVKRTLGSHIYLSSKRIILQGRHGICPKWEESQWRWTGKWKSISGERK